MIRVNEVKVTNFLSFEKQVLIQDIKPISVFVGPNNSGKSNLVRCLDFYHNLSQLQVTYAEQIQEMKNRFGLNDHLTIEVRYDYVNENQPVSPLEITHFISYDKKGDFESEKIRFKKKETNNELQVFIQEKVNDTYSASLQNSESMDAFYLTQSLAGVLV
jgi:AAA15 family ATPase/GTPase